MKEVIKEKDELYLVFEYQQQNVYQLYQTYKEKVLNQLKGQRISEKEIQTIIYQTVCALTHTHKHGFFHRDLKPENLLISNGLVKICDFGLAREIRSRPPFTEYVSTRWYRAPEILLKSQKYNSPVDIFALGCIMAELYLLYPLFCGTSEIDQLNKLCQLLGPPNSWTEGNILMQQNKIDFTHYNSVQLNSVILGASPQAIQMISDMLKWDPQKRPTAQQLLKYSFFDGYDPNNQKMININNQITQNSSKRDFKIPNIEEDNINKNNVKEKKSKQDQFIKQNNLKTETNSSFNLSEIMDDIDKIHGVKEDLQIYNKQNNNDLYNHKNINIVQNNQKLTVGQEIYNQDIKLNNENLNTLQNFQNQTNRNAHMKYNNNKNQKQIFKINIQNNDELLIKGRYK